MFAILGLLTGRRAPQSMSSPVSDATENSSPSTDREPVTSDSGPSPGSSNAMSAIPSPSTVEVQGPPLRTDDLEVISTPEAQPDHVHPPLRSSVDVLSIDAPPSSEYTLSTSSTREAEPLVIVQSCGFYSRNLAERGGQQEYAKQLGVIRAQLYDPSYPVGGDHNLSADVAKSIRDLSEVVADSAEPVSFIADRSKGEILKRAFDGLNDVMDAKTCLLEVFRSPISPALQAEGHEDTRADESTSDGRSDPDHDPALAQDSSHAETALAPLPRSGNPALRTNIDAIIKLPEPEDLFKADMSLNFYRFEDCSERLRSATIDALMLWKDLHAECSNEPNIFDAPAWYLRTYFQKIYVLSAVSSSSLLGFAQGPAVGAAAATALLCAGLVMDGVKNSLDQKRNDPRSMHNVEVEAMARVRKLCDRVIPLLLSYEELRAVLQIDIDVRQGFRELHAEDEARIRRMVLCFDRHFDSKPHNGIQIAYCSVQHHFAPMIEGDDVQLRAGEASMARWMRQGIGWLWGPSRGTEQALEADSRV